MLCIILLLFHEIQGEIQTSMQNLKESHLIDLMEKYPYYQNASYSIQSIIPMNDYTKLQNSSLLNINIEQVISESNQFVINNDLFCPISTFSFSDYPITIYLNLQSLTVIEYAISNQSMFQKQQQNIDLQFIVPQIQCTSIYGLINDIIIYIDCSLIDNGVTIFYRLEGQLIFENGDYKSIELSAKQYKFDDQDQYHDPNLYWSQCRKKEIKYIQNHTVLKLIYYCLKEYYYQQHTAIDEALLFVEISRVNELIQVQIYNKSNFQSCTKKIDKDQQFFIQQLVVNSYVATKEVYEQLKDKIWLFSLLIHNRAGVCKCGNLQFDSVQCQFLELQEGNYTQLYATSYSDEIKYLYVLSQIFVYRINLELTWTVGDDRIDAYYYIKNDRNYQPFKAFLYRDFLFVHLSEEGKDYSIQSCINGEQPGEQNYLSLLFYKQLDDEQLIPNYVYETNHPFYRIKHLISNGNYYNEWNSFTKTLTLKIINNQMLTINYIGKIDENFYLNYNIMLKIDHFSGELEEKVKLIIVEYNNPNFFLLEEDSNQDLYSFKEELYQFNLNRNLMGPLLNFYDIDDKYKSVIEFIREIKFTHIPQEFIKIYNGKFIYDGVDSWFMLLGTIITGSDNNLGYQHFKFETTSQQFVPDGSFKVLVLKGFQTDSIRFIDLNIFTILIGDLNKNFVLICYVSNFENCVQLGGDFLENDKYMYIESHEYNCVDDQLFAIPINSKEVFVYSYNCPDIYFKDKIQLTKRIGHINTTLIKELEDSIIKDAYFQILDEKLSFLLLSNGMIMQLLSESSLDGKKVNFQVINRIQNECKPQKQNSALFFLQHNQRKFMIYVCQDIDKTVIYEYRFINTYTLRYSREYGLFGYEVNSEYKCFSDNKVVYIPVGQLEYLAFSPFHDSPNMLLHAIQISMQRNVTAIPVIVNNYDSREWNIFSMAFFYDQNIGQLFYLNEQPVYYGQMKDSEINKTNKHIMIYQQNNDKLLFRQFNLTFDYSDSIIKCNLSNIEKYTTNNKLVVDLFKAQITGAVEDVTFILDEQYKDIVIQKHDILEINKFICDHYWTLEIGIIFDMMNLESSEYSTLFTKDMDELNLIFLISQHYLVIVEKPNVLSTIRILKLINLQQFNQNLINLKTCKLSMNLSNQILFYCYKDQTYSQQKLNLVQLAQYYLITFKYTKNDSSFTIIEYVELDINLGSRIKIESITPIYRQGSTFQFIQYYFENSPDQYELVVGQIIDNTLKYQQILQSSSFDANLIGQLAFDTLFIKDSQEILLVTLAYDQMKIELLNYSLIAHNFTIPKTFIINYAALNHSIFKSETHQNLVSIQLLEQGLPGYLMLLGTDNAFYEIILSQIFSAPILNLRQIYSNYFQCQHTKQQEPSIEVQKIGLNIRSIVSACVKQNIEKNFFFEDRFEHTHDSYFVYVQVFQKGPLEHQILSPSRVYKFYESYNRLKFQFTSYQWNKNNHILFENNTYFLVDYIQSPGIKFDVYRDGFITSKQVVNGKLNLHNIYTNQNIQVALIFDSIPLQSNNHWIIYVSISIGLLIFIVLIGLLLRKYRQKRQLVHSHSGSMEMLDEVIKDAVLQESRRKFTQKGIDPGSESD